EAKLSVWLFEIVVVGADTVTVGARLPGAVMVCWVQPLHDTPSNARTHRTSEERRVGPEWTSPGKLDPTDTAWLNAIVVPFNSSDPSGAPWLSHTWYWLIASRSGSPAENTEAKLSVWLFEIVVVGADTVTVGAWLPGAVMVCWVQPLHDTPSKARTHR